MRVKAWRVPVVAAVAIVAWVGSRVFAERPRRSLPAPGVDEGDRTLLLHHVAGLAAAAV